MLINLVYRILRIYWFLVRPITIGVRILLIKDGSVVLVKHSYQDAWYLPGGGVKRGESLEQAIRREAAEECGATIQKIRFLGIYTNIAEYKSDHTSLFLGENFTLKEKDDHEIDQVALFPFQELPDHISPGSCRKIEAYTNENLETTGLW